MKVLLAVHCEAGQSSDPTAEASRPQGSTVRDYAQDLARFLGVETLKPDAIVCSTDTAARHVAATVAKVLDFTDDIHYFPELASPQMDGYVDVLAATPDDAAVALVVSDSGGLEKLVKALGGVEQNMRDGTLADIRLSIDSWSEVAGSGNGTLRRAWHKEEIARILREPGLDDL